MTSLLRFRPLVAVLVALTVLVTACGGDDDAVIAGADADTVIASLADRELTAGMLDDLLPDGSNTVPSRIATVVESWLVANALELELAERGFPITDEDRELAVAAVGEVDGGHVDEVREEPARREQQARCQCQSSTMPRIPTGTSTSVGSIRTVDGGTP